jgi:hypothetical protein
VTEVARNWIKSSLPQISSVRKRIGITFTPSRLNSLLVMSSITGIFDRVENWIKSWIRLPQKVEDVGPCLTSRTRSQGSSRSVGQVYARARGRPKRSQKKEPSDSTPTPTRPDSQPLRSYNSSSDSQRLQA